MNNNTIKGLFFVTGAAVGAFCTFVALKTKYDKMYAESVASVKKAWKKKTNNGPDNTSELNEDPEILKATAEERINYSAMVNNSGYSDKEILETKQKNAPYVISPDEFADNVDYNVYSFLYFADGVLTDDVYDQVEDIENTVGSDFMDHFGEYESDSVFVRNDVKGCDYEILMDERNYADVLKIMPPKMED